MKSRLRASIPVLLVLAGPQLAYAQIEQFPDPYVLLVVMIFPVAIIGRRLAGDHPPHRERRWPFLRLFLKGLFLVLATIQVLFEALIGWPGPIPLIFLCYGLVRGALVIKRGMGQKRFAIGSFIILFSLLVAHYDMALRNINYCVEPATIRRRIGHIALAEDRFQRGRLLDVNKNDVGEYGTLPQVAETAVLFSSAAATPNCGYEYIVVLAGDPARDEKEAFLYAKPTKYGSYSKDWWRLPPALPFLYSEPRAQLTFAVSLPFGDEGLQVRATDLGQSRPVTREEAQNWPEIDP